MSFRARPGSARAAVCGLALASGCAAGPYPLERHRPAEPTPAVVVHALTDGRDEAVRSGQSAPWRPILVGVAQRGVLRLGDDAYSPAPLEALQTDLRATLGSLVWPARAEPLVVRGRLDRFDVDQPRSREFNLFRPGALRTYFGPSRARLRARFELDGPDGSRVEWVDVEVRRANAEPGETAVDAIAMASERLARRLWRHWGRHPVGAPLDVELRDGCGLIGERSRELAAGLTEVFAREAGLSLRVRVVPWVDAPRGQTASQALERVSRPERGVAIALLPLKAEWNAVPETGLAVPFGRRAVADCADDGAAPLLTVSHELAHLLGAVPVHDRYSIMYAQADFDGRFFDALNRRILRAAARSCLPEMTPGEEPIRELLAIYATAARHPGQVEATGVDAAERALRQRYGLAP